jgi:anti-anti-sigma factor
MEVRVPDVTSNGMPYVVEVSGDIDIASVANLEEPVIGAIREGRRPVILELSDCWFIDSSGIRLLLRAQHLLAEQSAGTHQLAVVARDDVARLLRLVSLDKVIPVVGSRAEAEGTLDIPTPA